MMMKKRSVGILSLGLGMWTTGVLFEMGCQNDSTPGPGIPIDDMPGEVARSVCPRAWDCCTPTPGAFPCAAETCSKSRWP